MAEGVPLASRRLPAAAPARVLALGAWLKNTACLLAGDTVLDSPLHGDLGTPEACVALERSAEALLAAAGGRVDAVAHDLHPDFPSTALALEIAARLDVPAFAVQHHHAHVAVALAEHGRDAAVGLALDGVGLGSDGVAWGGELLDVQASGFTRCAHLPPLALPGGDLAAREPWRMAAAALHALGRGDEIAPRFAPAVGERLAAGVATLLERRLNCPPTTSAGRWFDAMAGLLGLSVRQAQEAEAAIALEAAARRGIEAHGEPPADAGVALDAPAFGAFVSRCLAAAEAEGVDAAAARFHLGLADALAAAAIAAAHANGRRAVVLAGGCFHNRVLSQALAARIAAAGLEVLRPEGRGPGDAGLALGQAWVAAQAVAAGRFTHEPETVACA